MVITLLEGIIANSVPVGKRFENECFQRISFDKCKDFVTGMRQCAKLLRVCTGVKERQGIKKSNPKELDFKSATVWLTVVGFQLAVQCHSVDSQQFSCL